MVASLKCRFSIFRQITGWGPSIYQIMYVDKTFSTLVSSKTSESVYIFRGGHRSLDECGAARKTILNKSAFLLGTQAVSGIKD